MLRACCALLLLAHTPPISARAQQLLAPPGTAEYTRFFRSPDAQKDPLVTEAAVYATLSERLGYLILQLQDDDVSVASICRQIVAEQLMQNVQAASIEQSFSHNRAIPAHVYAAARILARKLRRDPRLLASLVLYGIAPVNALQGGRTLTERAEILAACAGMKLRDVCVAAAESSGFTPDTIRHAIIRHGDNAEALGAAMAVLREAMRGMVSVDPAHLKNGRSLREELDYCTDRIKRIDLLTYYAGMTKTGLFKETAIAMNGQRTWQSILQSYIKGTIGPETIVAMAGVLHKRLQGVMPVDSSLLDTGRYLREELAYCEDQSARIKLLARAAGLTVAELALLALLRPHTGIKAASLGATIYAGNTIHPTNLAAIAAVLNGRPELVLTVDITLLEHGILPDARASARSAAPAAAACLPCQ